MPTSSRHVLIAGAGIGGLTLAAALRRAGVRASVFERAEVLGWVGAGITMQPNAMAALGRIGLADAVAAGGAAPTTSAILDPSGRAVMRVSIEQVQRELDVPMVCIHRARLQEALLEAAGREQLQLGREVTGFQEEGGGVTVTLSDGSTARGDVLVGADGLRSAVRRGVVGETPLRYAGYTSWRGIAPAVPSADPRMISETWGPGARFGVVPIGFGEIYWFATRDAPAGEKDAPGAVHAHLTRLFGHWHAPIADLLAATPEERILRTDIQDRAPLERWTKGAVTLLGDAAHPMTPNLGQGGCQAVEDAVVLAERLAEGGDVAVALAGYEQKRRVRANQFVQRSEQMGRLAQLSNPVGRWLRDNLLRLLPDSMATRQVRDGVRFPG